MYIHALILVCVNCNQLTVIVLSEPLYIRRKPQKIVLKAYQHASLD